jgi:hypothetical protein
LIREYLFFFNKKRNRTFIFIRKKRENTYHVPMAFEEVQGITDSQTNGH